MAVVAQLLSRQRLREAIGCPSEGLVRPVCRDVLVLHADKGDCVAKLRQAFWRVKMPQEIKAQALSKLCPSA